MEIQTPTQSDSWERPQAGQEIKREGGSSSLLFTFSLRVFQTGNVKKGEEKKKQTTKQKQDDTECTV